MSSRTTPPLRTKQRDAPGQSFQYESLGSTHYALDADRLFTTAHEFWPVVDAQARTNSAYNKDLPVVGEAGRCISEHMSYGFDVSMRTSSR